MLFVEQECSPFSPRLIRPRGYARGVSAERSAGANFFPGPDESTPKAACITASMRLVITETPFSDKGSASAAREGGGGGGPPRTQRRVLSSDRQLEAGPGCQERQPP